MEFSIPRGTQMVQGIPIGRLNNHESRISALENASSSIGSEVSLTAPNNSTQIFNFAHNIGIIHWNGQQVFSIGNQAAYSQTGPKQITFTGSNVPVVNDDIINTF